MNTVALTLSDGIVKNNRPCRLRALMTSTLALLPVTRTIGVFPTGAQVLPTVGVNRTTDSSSKKSRARCCLARCLIRGHSVAIHRARALGPCSKPELSERELQILKQLCAGKSNKEIAQKLYIRESTVKHHAKSVFKKLGAVSRADVIAKSVKRGLIRIV